jgi:negative regulator of sigma E activity
MDDRLKESISALMDDESNELELQRILSHVEDDELLETWKTYHNIKSVLQHDQNDAIAIDISQLVSAAIAQEAPLSFREGSVEAHEDATILSNDLSSQADKQAIPSSIDNHSKHTINERPRNTKLMSKISSGFAIAASIFVAFIFVLNNGVNSGQGLNENLQASASAAVSVGSSVSGLQNVSSVVDKPENSSTEKQPKIIVEFTEAHARRFNEYLLRHAEHSVASSHAGMMPLARVASVNAVGI